MASLLLALSLCGTPLLLASQGPETPVVPGVVRVFLDTRFALQQQPEATRELRRNLKHPLVVVDDRSEADVQVRLLFFRAPYANWRPSPYWSQPFEISALLRGSGFMAQVKVGGDSSPDCATALAREIARFFPPPGRGRAELRL